ncbi:MAG TPA: peptidylprolyl isomerase [Candidatus Bathyarchaeia archaeon]|nr:peptidylprolyl isomerase [Candidatus Bathyarchaeia archaeon]
MWASFYYGAKVLIAVGLLIVVSVIAFQVICMDSSKANIGPGRILLDTNMGNIIIELYDDMSITSGNFRNLTKRGVYDGTIFQSHS